MIWIAVKREGGLPASGGEGTGNAEKDDLFTGSEGVYGHRLEFVFVVEVGESTIWNHVANCNRGHFSRRCWLLNNNRSVSISASVLLLVSVTLSIYYIEPINTKIKETLFFSFFFFFFLFSFLIISWIWLSFGVRRRTHLERLRECKLTVISSEAGFSTDGFMFFCVERISC